MLSHTINQWPLPCPVLGRNDAIDWLSRLQSYYKSFEERGVSMNRKSVYCMASTDSEAAVIYQRLKDEGFIDRHITVLVRDERGGSHSYSPGNPVDRPVRAVLPRHANS